MEEDTAVMDQTSELSDATIRNILFRLPMKNVVQASIVSKKWRYHWTFNPNFDFNLSAWDPADIVPFINRFMASYNGTHLHTFRFIAFPREDISKEIEKWIDFAVGKQVSVLDFYVDKIRFVNDGCLLYDAPESLFSCDSIETLKLNKCVFSPPLGFEGFASLKTICLRNTRISEETVEQLVSKTPLLETLSLHEPESIKFLKISVTTPQLSYIHVHGDNMQGIEISAPGLEFLDFTGNPETFQVSAPILMSAQLPALLSARETGDLTAEVLRQWASTIAQFSDVLALTVNMHFLMVLYADCYINERNPPIKFEQLKAFHVMGDLDETYGVSALVNFFRHCSSIKSVIIGPRPKLSNSNWVCDYMRMEHVKPIIVTDEEEETTEKVEEEGGAVGSAAGTEDFSEYDDLVHLKSIVMRGFSGNARQMKLVKFLLQKAVGLDILILEWQPSYYSPTVIKELAPLAAKSSHAEIRERRFYSSDLLKI